MGKEVRGGIVDKFLSKTAILEKKEEIEKVPENKEEKNETKKEARYHFCRYKGFYLDKENELKLKKLQLYFIEKGERLNESELINRAISYFYSFILRNENIEI
jgi:hypothetical protein